MKRRRESLTQDSVDVNERASTTNSLENSLNDLVSLRIYVAAHCANCAYAYEVAAVIERSFPKVDVRFVDMAEPQEEIPEVVFATPTYLLNGRVWSLGNPSLEQVHETFGQFFPAPQKVAN